MDGKIGKGDKKRKLESFPRTSRFSTLAWFGGTRFSAPSLRFDAEAEGEPSKTLEIEGSRVNRTGTGFAPTWARKEKQERAP